MLVVLALFDVFGGSAVIALCYLVTGGIVDNFETDFCQSGFQMNI
jgi:hypothetical protein